MLPSAGWADLLRGEALLQDGLAQPAAAATPTTTPPAAARRCTAAAAAAAATAAALIYYLRRCHQHAPVPGPRVLVASKAAAKLEAAKIALGAS